MTVILKQSTSIDIRVGPFLDVGDFFTPETGVTIGASDEAEILKANGAATVAMTGTFAAVTSCDGWYDYTLAAGDVDTVGELVIVMQDDDVYLPVFVRAYVVEEAVYDAMYAASATGPLQGTTAGNTLDVAATGEAGVDLGNVTGTLGQANVGWVDANSRVDVGAFLGTAVAAATASGEVNSNVTEWLGTAAATPTVAGVPEVDITHVEGATTLSELAQGIPAATPSLSACLMLLYMALRNELTVTSSSLTISNNAGTVITKKALTDNGTTYTEAEAVSGP